MARDTATDTITLDLIQAYVRVISLVEGWGVVTPYGVAVYGNLGLPFPREPFPACYVYFAGEEHDFRQGTGLRRDTEHINARIIGGPITPGYKFLPEDKVYQVLKGVVNELTYRRYLEDPTSNDAPFRYIDPEGKLTVGSIGRIQGFNYGEQGTFVGIEVPTTVMLAIKLGRLS